MGAKGRIATKLRGLLEAEGFDVAFLTPAAGYWRSNRMADVYRWEGRGNAITVKGLPRGMPVSFGCWDTMTECARQGIHIERDEGRGTHFMIWPRAT